MRLRGVRLILVLLAFLVTASFSTTAVWAGTCHTTHASFYCQRGGEQQYLGRRSVEASYNWASMACVPTGCVLDSGGSVVSADWECDSTILRYGCSWWRKTCASTGVNPCYAFMAMKFSNPVVEGGGTATVIMDCMCGKYAD